MIFSELYSAYYNAVAGILRDVIGGECDEQSLRETVMKHAFSESVFTILPSLKSGKWQLMHEDLTTPVKHIPTMPLTFLEKRWLKAVTLDPRIRLFELGTEGLADVDPLFTPEDIVVYDSYADGDPYFDEGYIQRFRMILGAIREKQPLVIETVNRRGSAVRATVMPLRLEYSEKDDKFRLISSGSRRGVILNLARIISCSKYTGDRFIPAVPRPVKYGSLTLRILDERNALERCMLHFAHFEKQAERVDDKHYLVRIRYDTDDETEMVIRILGFGPLVEVIEPQEFRDLIVERLRQQKSCDMR